MTENQVSYAVPEATWLNISNEIQALSVRIQAGEELNDSDFTKLKATVKDIEDYGKAFTKAVNQQSKQYKQWLEWKLKDIGYDQVKNYMAQQKLKNDQLINQRMNQKLNKFREIIQEELSLHPLIASTGLSETILNMFIGRFPKINSGAVSNEISNWAPIQSVVHINMGQVEEILEANKVMLYLPLHSNTFRTFSEYLRTGDVTKLSNIEETLKSDGELLRNVVMKQQMHSVDDVISMINEVTTSKTDAQTKLTQIKQLIFVWETL